ncbi:MULTISPECIES: peroxiredoxin family protein [Bacillus]|uniref:Peroxiredoxin n=1 Tax=Bacillus thuringiensis TaxID=1428 RepID=A0ABD6R8M4_BACTU|nr:MULTISPECIES: peroxiredoxin family protein [Bacillus]MCX2703094.1 peroxiredoxin family protein [Bacillus sp. AS_5]WIL49987.1 peroxiredoxin family protein [Bacillus bombysepticus]KAB7677159.1 redoxin domain-containing protein [Bacillus sp. B1-WWTP-T-0.5-Post-4]MBH0320535.1 redoxin domain-containing protein [Bacillus cereus]MCW4654380.1 peroxiredoxin family protein [Bacillus sp. AS_3]
MTIFTLGKKVPNFTLPEITGQEFSLETYLKESKGWKLIIFFRGAWCPVCVHDLKDLEESKGFFEGKNVHLITVSTDKLENLKKMALENNLSFPILSDESLVALKAYDVFYHGDDAPYEDHGTHGEPAYFLVDENGQLLYQQRQTSPFGRPTSTELRKIVQYIGKNLKSK